MNFEAYTSGFRFYRAFLTSEQALTGDHNPRARARRLSLPVLTEHPPRLGRAAPASSSHARRGLAAATPARVPRGAFWRQELPLLLPEVTGFPEVARLNLGPAVHRVERGGRAAWRRPAGPERWAGYRWFWRVREEPELAALKARLRRRVCLL